MQSDERIEVALNALRPRITLFWVAVSSALDRARTTVSAERRPALVQATLGELGGRLIDPDRFAMVSSDDGALDEASRLIIDRAIHTLERIMRSGDEQFVVDVPPEGTLRFAVRSRLAALGAAFGAATLIELIKRRAYDAGQHQLDSAGYPFERWSGADRKVAPPLVIRVDGADLDALELASLMDGCVRLILLVNEPCAAAPLARLISPGAFVAQADDVRIMDSLTDFDGPAVVAIMSGDEARFVHDPRNGSELWQRMRITRIPTIPARKALGVRTITQQRDDIAHLKALAESPKFAPESNGSATTLRTTSASDATERLTSWLLEQTGFDGQGGEPS